MSDAPIDPPPRDLKAQLRARLPFYLLVVALGVLVVSYYDRQPSKVDVDLVLGAARPGLEGFVLRYEKQGELLHRVAFSYTKQRPAPPTEQHRVRLADGDYDLIIELTYRSKVPKLVRKRTRLLGPRVARTRRLFPVRGSGAVSVIIADDND